MLTDDTLERICTQCKDSFPPTDEYFYVKKHGKYGVDSVCKMCRRLQSNKYYEDNRERVVTRSKVHYYRTLVYQRERSRKYLLINKDKSRLSQKRWIKQNRRRVNEYARCYRLRRKNNGGNVTVSEILNMYLMQGGLCFYCLKPLNWEYQIDHFIPVTKGGSSNIANLRLACSWCNRSKSNKDPYVWMEEQIALRPYFW